MNKKRVWIACISLVLLIAAGVAGWMYYKDVNTIVSVVPVELLNSDWGLDTENNSGVVINSLSQNIVPDGEREVEKIYVKAGQKVKIGDKILTYDMTIEKLDLELKGYEVKELEFSIKRAQTDLANLKKGIVTDDFDYGYGSVGRKNPILASLFLRTVESEVEVETVAPEEDEEENQEEDEEDEDEPLYTAEEIRAMITAKENEIADLKLQLKEEKLAYDNMKKEVDDATITAVVDGVVQEVNDPETAVEEGSSLVVIVSEDKLYVQSVVDEFNYDSIKSGTLITATSWETGNTFQAEIIEVSEYPVSQTGYAISGTSNPNVSYYPYSAVILGDTSAIQTGESVSITFDQGIASTDENVYIPLSYVRSEGNISYVYVADETNRLKKKTVVTGQTLYNTVIEIKSGLNNGDYIAFPYGNQVKEGVRTKVSEDDMDIVY